MRLFVSDLIDASVSTGRLDAAAAEANEASSVSASRSTDHAPSQLAGEGRGSSRPRAASSTARSWPSWSRQPPASACRCPSSGRGHCSRSEPCNAGRGSGGKHAARSRKPSSCSRRSAPPPSRMAPLAELAGRLLGAARGEHAGGAPDRRARRRGEDEQGGRRRTRRVHPHGGGGAHAGLPEAGDTVANRLARRFAESS